MQPFTWRTADEIKAILDGLDHLAAKMEQRWGVGRLELVVDESLRTRFRRQRAKLDAAIATNDPHQILRHSTAMRIAWTTLDSAAKQAGETPLEADVWEIPLRSGTVAALVRSNPEAVETTRSGRYLEIWTTREIANVIDHFRNHPNSQPPQPYQTIPGNPVHFTLDGDPNDQIPL